MPTVAAHNLHLINTTPKENIPLPGFHGVMMLTSPGDK